MERYTSLDKSRLLNFKIRIGETSVPKLLTFVNADGSPHPIIDYEFELPVKKAPVAVANLFKLTVGDGLTVQGDDENQLLIEVNATRSSVTKQDNVFFGKLIATSEDHTWLNGDWEFHNGKYDGVTETDTITIAEDGGSVTIVVSGGSGGDVDLTNAWILMESFDASDNLFPEIGGTGSLGVVMRGNVFPLSQGGTLDGEFVPSKSLLVALEDEPEQDATKWRII